MIIEKPIDFIKDERFRDMITSLRRAQKDFDQASNDAEFRRTSQKLAESKALIDSYIVQAKRNKNLIREVNLKQRKFLRFSKHHVSKVSEHRKSLK
ncbi:hypothetical protein SPFL3102_01145 [Sporomusaceae bacterium FL31]|nr:hypothetical protein SPFL3101_00246 [Sporomusaceae bacterium FL31]GCE33341.1 hypothetical protein SPFL3102_01145 [Sporomusaceae bacterium]